VGGQGNLQASRGVAAPSNKRKVPPRKAELITPPIQRDSELYSSVNLDKSLEEEWRQEVSAHQFSPPP